MTEIIVYTAIMAILVSLTFRGFLSFRDNQALEKSTSQIVTALNKARSLTISSKNASQYGVHFLSNKVIVFSGAQYSEGNADNQTFSFDSTVALGTTTFYGGGSDIVFQRLTGATDDFGTSTIYLKKNISNSRNVVVKPSGFVQY